ncbi:MAG: hypothetical protein J0I43_01520 [Microbacterium sp.]|uniref:hypothetical protein n=1 Tax=Microbacterium sp. TaxID=51671 RepID=UPI001AD2651E|nr:hypothetical protein [Microbacterium sp.]MBN9176039.1 hypothetical protein [Microbacterium sp.]
MVAHVLRLRLDLLLGALRGDAAHTIRRIIGLGVLVAVLVGVFLGAARLHAVDADVAQAVTVVAGSALTLGFFIGPLVGGFDDQLDPRRFAVFGASPVRVAGATFVASIISLPVLALVAVAVAVGGIWRAQGAPAAIVVCAMVLTVLTCMLAAKTALAVGALVLRERRSRELSGLFIVAIVVVAMPVAVFFVSLEWRGAVPSALAEAVRILALTPLGAAWAIPGAALSGSAAAEIVVAVLTVLALGAVWFALVRLLLTTTERPGSGRERAGLGWFALTPSTPGGGIAARSLLYWLRDPRYVVNLVIVPVAAGVVVAPLLLVGVPVEYVALVPAPLMALFFGWLAHNDLAYDSTALWMHVASAVRGSSDRVGRLVPVLLVGTAALAVSIPLLVSLHGRWAILPAMAGVCVSLFLCGMGLSSLSSVVAPYPVSRPGDSPFQQPQRTGGGLAQGVVLIGAIVLSAPALWLGWTALIGDEDAAWGALWAGIATGLVVLAAGVAGGGAYFSRRGGHLMEFVEST